MRVLGRLRREWIEGGKAIEFDHLKVCLIGESTEGYRSVGRALGLSEGAVKVSVHRLKRRYRSLLRQEIAATVLTRTRSSKRFSTSSVPCQHGELRIGPPL
jgi:RNA polymerase sigma-70 factor (ECF subfamily)